MGRVGAVAPGTSGASSAVIAGYNTGGGPLMPSSAARRVPPVAVGGGVGQGREVPARRPSVPAPGPAVARPGRAR